jgi:hypothetical protein
MNPVETLAIGLLTGALLGYLAGRIARPKPLTWADWNEINRHRRF